MGEALPGLIRFIATFPDVQTYWGHLRFNRWGCGWEGPRYQGTEDRLFLEEPERQHGYMRGHHGGVTSQKAVVYRTSAFSTNMVRRSCSLGLYAACPAIVSLAMPSMPPHNDGQSQR